MLPNKPLNEIELNKVIECDEYEYFRAKNHRKICQQDGKKTENDVESAFQLQSSIEPISIFDGSQRTDDSSTDKTIALCKFRLDPTT